MFKKACSSIVLTLTIAMTSNIASANQALRASVDLTGASSAAAIMPVASLACIAEGSNMSPECGLVVLIGAPTATATSSLLLLKEVQAAQPDALNYIAGAAPSPALYAAVEKLQDFAAENLGKEISFEDAVNDIVSGI